MITTITLHGEMGRIFGRTWKLAVSSPAEALRAIEANHPGLQAYLGNAEGRGIRFRIKVGKEQLKDPEMANFAHRGRKISISPVVHGSKSKYIGLIIGVVLIAVTWGAGAGFFGKGMMDFMATSGALGIKGLTYSALIGGVGISMAIGGVAQMLAPKPKATAAGDAGTQSYLFNGPANVSAQGGPVPLCYGGPILVGSIRISAGITSEDRPGKLTGGAANTGGYTGGGGYTGDGNTGEGPFSRHPDLA